jgi:ATP-dependent DNA helicase
VIRDIKALSKYHWKYIIVDEGHRLKNFNCLLVRRLKSLQSDSRLLLSGTPLQNNLSELWSLLNFILPDVFDDLELFQSWFDFSVIYEKDRSSELMEREANERIVSKLHDVLRPFVLRRLKSQVMTSLPSKFEIVVYAGMTAMQREFYKAIVKKELGPMLEACNKKTPLRNMMMQLLKCCNHPYLIYEDEGASTSALIESCGKLKLLDRLLTSLLKKKHKVLIFSQMTKLLDILEDFLTIKGHE